MNHSSVSDKTLLSFLGVIFTLSVTVCVLKLGHMGPTPISMGIHSYLVNWCQANQNLNFVCQREAHAAALACIAILILAFSWLKTKTHKFNKSKSFYALKIGFAISILVFCVENVRYWLSQPVPKLAWLVTVILFAVLSVFGRLVPKWLIVIPAIFGLFAVIPGLVVNYDASWMPPNVFVEFQQGYSVVTSQCDRISMGHQIFADVKPNYGLFFQILSAIFEKQFGIFTFGENIQLIRWLQAFTVALTFTIYAWYSRCKLFPLMVGFALVLPWFHTNQLSLLYPNLSPWRSFGFPLSAFLLILCTRLPATYKFYAMGALGGFCITLNLETGISIFLGMLSMIYFDQHHQSGLISKAFLNSAIKCVTGMFLSLGLLYLCAASCLEYLPDLQEYFRHLQTLQYMTKTGYSGGFKLEYSPLPIFMFCHYSLALFRLSLSTQPLSNRDCFRAFIATVALVWSAYYFNRPHEWYLQPQFFFYGILAIDLARFAQTNFTAPNMVASRIAAFLCLGCILAPQIVYVTDQSLPSYSRMLNQISTGKLSHENAALISGIFAEPQVVSEIKTKAEYLSKEAKTNDLIYLTGSTVLIPKLTKLYLKAPFDDPYQELTYIGDTEKFLRLVKESGVNKVLIDDKKNYLSGDTFRNQCWTNIEEKLKPEFYFEEFQNGWRVLKRKVPNNAVSNTLGLEHATR